METSGQLAAPAVQDLLQSAALAGEWELDPSRSAVSLRSRSIAGLVRVNGAFRQVTGSGSVSPAGAVHGVITVAAASIDTKNAQRDRHLRSADFFDSDNYPDITFAADGVRPASQGITVTGVLTVRDQARPLTVDAAVAARGVDEVTLDAEVQINRADFGLTWNRLGMVSKDNALTVHAVFIRR
jgi:polyisoprenoid-binding protein YceI